MPPQPFQSRHAAADPGGARFFQTQRADATWCVLLVADTIFIVRDDRNEEKDQRLSKYVMNMHAKAAVPTENVEGPIPVPLLKRYIS